MTHAERILGCLDGHLTCRVELTLYGRAALTLGFHETPEDYALSRDVDAVLWLGQAEALSESTNFWEAVEKTKQILAEPQRKKYEELLKKRPRRGRRHRDGDQGTRGTDVHDTPRGEE